MAALIEETGTSRALLDALDEAERGGRSALPLGGGSLALSAHGTLLFVGPWLDDERTGCLDCALLWWADVAPRTAGSSPSPSPFDWEAVVVALVDEVEAAPERSARSITVLDRSTGELRRHGFVPHPSCSRCAVSWHDRPGRVDLSTPQPALAGPLRTRSFDRAVLRSELLDVRFGPIAHSYRDESSPLALVACEAVVPGHATREGGYGRSTDFAASEVPAFLEGIERVLGGYRDPRSRSVSASFAGLSGADDSAVLDPRTLGTHPTSSYDDESVAFVPFDPDTATDWIPGYSTEQARPIWIPEHIAYWHSSSAAPRFLYESSNGCAVGGSLEEAALHGLLEVIERDAFLLAWYSRSRLVEIELDRAGVFAHVLDDLDERDLRLRVLDLTSDFGVPVALAVITADGEAVASGRAPAMSLASGAGLDATKAIRTAIEECMTNAVMYPEWVARHPEKSNERCRPMLDDFRLVRTLDDHTGLHGLWEARPLWAFLDAPSGTIAETEYRARPSIPTDDVAVALARLVERTNGLGSDVIVVDQGNDDVEALGIHAVKVVVPGSIPMTFGHLNQRTVGLPRLERATSLLRGARPWTDEPFSLNPAPHPFP